MEQEAVRSEPVVLSPEEVQVALKLLAEEDQASQPHLGKLLGIVVSTFALVVGLITCPLGILVLLVDQGIGRQLLLIAGIGLLVCFVVLSLQKDIIRTIAGRGFFEGAFSDEWKKRSWMDISGQAFTVSKLLINGLVGSLWLVALAWFLYDLFVLRTFNWVPLVLTVLPLSLMVAVDQYREYVYNSRVAELRTRLARSSAVTAEADISPPTELSSADVATVAQAQQRNFKSNVKRAVKQYAASGVPWYSVVLQPDVIGYLQAQPTELKSSLRDRFDSLQFQPRPYDARPDAAPGRYVVEHLGLTISYAVDDVRERVTLQGIKPKASMEGGDGT